jgi:hypothetical protein
VRTLACSALSISAAAVLLAGCGGSQSSVGPPATAPANAANFREGRGQASVAVGTYARSLLYVSFNSVELYTYPRIKALGSLGVAGDYLCSDRFGHIFVATQPGMGEVWVYNHGRSQPFAILYDPSVVGGCSVDPSTENVADAGYIPGSVTIWPYSRKRGWGLAQDHTIPNMGESRYCTYDSQGNLFIDGDDSGSFDLEELPKGSSTFTTITLDQKIGVPGSLQWTGKYLVVEDAINSYTGPAVIYRFVISGASGHRVSATTLTDSIANAQFLVHGSTVIGPVRQNSVPGLGFWSFPGGGAPVRTISTYPNPSGEALSLK